MLRLNDVSVRLDGRDILQQICFQLRPNRLTVLLGRNGSGKSTLLSCVNRQIPYTGAVFLNGCSTQILSPMQRAKLVAFLPQKMPDPRITVWELAALGRNPYLDFTGRLRETDRHAVDRALQMAEAETLARRYVDTLSGGEKQRAALAMILAQETPLILLDEPTAHMDQAFEARFLRKLKRLTEEKTVLAVLHDLNLAAEYADDILVLDEGRLVFSGSREECLDREVLERTFSLRRFTIREGEKDRIFFAAKLSY